MTKLRRRAVLRAGVASVGATGFAGSVAGQDDGGQTRPDFEGYIADSDGGYQDARGQEQVTVDVGAAGNGGNFAFSPAGLWIDPGTTIVWEWTGEGGQHNVVDEDGAFESELTAEQGFSFEHTFDEGGISTYFCQPHKSLEMKGAIAVGDDVPTVQGSGGGGEQQGQPYEFVGDQITKTIVAVVFGTLGLAAFSLLGAEGYAEYRTRGAAAATRDADAPVDAGEPVTFTEETAEANPVTEIGHDEYDPTGTATLILIYLVVIVLMWVFMYFVEFLGNGPTVIG